jgi:hypothetical protein
VLRGDPERLRQIRLQVLKLKYKALNILGRIFPGQAKANDNLRYLNGTTQNTNNSRRYADCFCHDVGLVVYRSSKAPG